MVAMFKYHTQLLFLAAGHSAVSCVCLRCLGTRAVQPDHVNMMPKRITTAWHYQTLLLSRAEVVDGQLCEDPSTSHIRYYSNRDWTLQYFLDRRLDPTTLCGRCKKPVSRHTISYAHTGYVPLVVWLVVWLLVVGC